MNELTNCKVDMPETLIVATNWIDLDSEREIAEGKHHKVDYIELAQYLSADYLDYRNTPRRVRPIDEKLRHDFGLSLASARKIGANRYCRIFAWSEQVGLPLALLKKLRLIDPSLELITMFHTPLLLPRLLAYQVTTAINTCDKLIFISEAEADEFQRRVKLDPEKIYVVHTPHDTDFYNPTFKPENRDPVGFVFSIGVAERDYPTLTRAMKAFPKIECKISATSNWDSHSGSYGERPLPPNIRIEHFTDPLSVREQSSRARFLVTPIKKNTPNWTAGCTSATLAGAMGKAIIASDIPGLREYIIDGVTGILVEPGNPTALAEAIEFLWDNPEEASKMGANGRARVVKDFSLPSWEKKVSKVLLSSRRSSTEESGLGAPVR